MCCYVVTVRLLWCSQSDACVVEDVWLEPIRYECRLFRYLSFNLSGYLGTCLPSFLEKAGIKRDDVKSFHSEQMLFSQCCIPLRVRKIIWTFHWRDSNKINSLQCHHRKLRNNHLTMSVRCWLQSAASDVDCTLLHTCKIVLSFISFHCEVSQSEVLHWVKRDNCT